MKVIMLSKIDCAGSGYKVCEAIRMHTDIDISLHSLRRGSRLGHPAGNVTGKGNQVLQQQINEADVVHVKGDWIPHDNYMGLKIMHKPVVQSVSGNLFRKIYHGGMERWTMDFYDKCSLKTAFTPDLLYPDYGDVWTPHPINSDDQAIEWQRKDPMIFIHSPTNTAKKGTKFLMSVFEALKGKVNFQVKILHGMSFQQVLELRKEATIFFDQFRVGFYGNSAIEAMQYGIPSAAWISPEAFEQSKGQLENCPVITATKTVGAWVKKLTEICNSDMEDLSRATKIWCDTVHGYRATALQWEKLYKSLL